MQTSSVGGSSVTEQTADTVQPAGPAAPSEVMIFTTKPCFATADHGFVNRYPKVTGHSKTALMGQSLAVANNEVRQHG